MDFIIATHNMKKRDELQRVLQPLGVNVFTAEQCGVILTDVEETGETFVQNAFLKSRMGCLESGMPCIADDSGLCVDALDGAPGVYSARFAGEHGNDDANIAKLLEVLKDVPDEKRTAKFVSTVCCTFPDGTEFSVTGECRGKIGYEKIGEGGFGYDPVFMYGDKSVAQMTAEEKDKISHRGNALRALSKKLEEMGITDVNK
ncbi:MAG: RdgB/HAM1 family non-canonical purine NTP pyrophosphatase [Clostridia bacterium]|nr:RdgB/HAM1 family non-canonical purine NTP pyrophosphatase [Clostridia bacterium]